MAVAEVMTGADIAQPVADRLLDLVMAPIRYPELIWILFPMITGLILMTIYFGRYKDEKLGWNTAVANAMILVFVSIDLFKKIYGVDSNPWDVIHTLWELIYYDIGMTDQMFITTLMAVLVFLWGITLVFFEFFHILPERLAFMVASPLPINLFAYTSIVVVYSTMDGDALIFSWATVVAALILFFAMWVLFSFIQWLEPKRRITEWKARE